MGSSNDLGSRIGQKNRSKIEGRTGGGDTVLFLKTLGGELNILFVELRQKSVQKRPPIWNLGFG